MAWKELPVCGFTDDEAGNLATRQEVIGGISVRCGDVAYRWGTSLPRTSDPFANVINDAQRLRAWPGRKALMVVVVGEQTSYNEDVVR